MKKIKTEGTGFSYEVIIDNDKLQSLPNKILKLGNYKNCFVVIDSKVKSIYGNEIKDIFEKSKLNTKFYNFRSSEKRKTMEGITPILKSLLKNNFSRDTILVAIGGGITGDAAAFAASVYMRGIPYIHVPTTLLAAVDSSIGGKTGINLSSVKNIVGSFYQPELVYIDTKFFHTLPAEEILCGIGESIKYAYLTDHKFYKFVAQNIDKIFALDSKTISRLVSTSVQYKASVVSEDEKEMGLRKLLNYGHTFAHAIESTLDHKIKHGQAVIIGITAANFLSKKLGLIDESELAGSLHILMNFTDKINLPALKFNSLYNIMRKDKKNKSGSIRFVLLKNIGEFAIDVEVPKSDVKYAFTEALKLFNSKLI